MLGGSAQAAPTQYLFRDLDSSIVWGRSTNPDRLRTVTTTIDDATVVMDVEVSTKTATGWQLDQTLSFKGTAKTAKRVTTITVSDGANLSATYTCKPGRVVVARADAHREQASSGEGVLGGRWVPRAAVRVDALVCGTESLVGLPEVLILADKPIEHVRADDDCCTTPGDSLRLIPADRSVRPLR